MTECFGFADASDRKALTVLWQEAFKEDLPQDIASFMNRFLADGQVPVLRLDGRIVSMLFLLPATVEYCARRYPVGYIYAGATAVHQRHKGYYRRLIAFAIKTAEQRGLAALFLKPADAALTVSYQRMGFCLPMTASPNDAHILCLSTNVSLPKLSMANYSALRARLLRQCGEAFVDWDATVFSYASLWCEAVGDEKMCALVSSDRIYEWLPARLDIGDVPGNTIDNTPIAGLLYPIHKAVFDQMPPIYMGYALD